MTKIIFHGKLKEKFGHSIELNIGNLKFLIKSIDCVKNGFDLFLRKINREGMNYSCVFENKNTIHFIPMVIGSGFWRKAFGFVVAIVGVALAFLGFPGFGSLLVGIGLNFIKGPPKQPAPQQITIGGSVYSLNSTKKNSTFASIRNNYVQGSIVQIGYGRLKVGCKNIQVSARNIPTNISFETDVYTTTDTNIELYG
jgi:predicted phage tail protein